MSAPMPDIVHAHTTLKRMSGEEPILQFFSYEHLAAPLQAVSVNFAMTAMWLVNNVARNPERSTALRKLLEAKDAAVRARMYRAQT